MSDDQRPERIWLLHEMGDEGSDVWSDDPNPAGLPDDEVYRTEYVRADALDARDAEIKRLRDVLERIARTGEGGASDQHAPDMWEACRTWACDSLQGGDDG